MNTRGIFGAWLLATVAVMAVLALILYEICQLLMPVLVWIDNIK